MELDQTRLQEAANGLLQSAILGRDLGESLQRVAAAGGASGAGFTKCLGDALTAVASPSLRDLSSAAEQFGVTIGTARNHLKRAMQKARVHSQVEMAALVATLSELIAD
jgi:hypothetical protein